MHPKQKHGANFMKNLTTIFCEYELLRGNSFIISYYHSFAEGYRPPLQKQNPHLYWKPPHQNVIDNPHLKYQSLPPSDCLGV